MQVNSARRWTLLAAAGGLAAAAARPTARQLAAVRRVAPELRHPVCYLPFPLPSFVAGLAHHVHRPGSIGPVPAGVAAERITLPAAGEQPGVDVTVYRPGQPAGPALLWMHGGGYLVGTTADCDDWCGRVAAELGATVVSVEYRLAPLHPFPAGLDDCWHALSWLREHASELGVDPARIAVGGESAGGGLAAAVAQRAADAGVDLAFQLLVYPMLDDRTGPRSARTGGWHVVWTPSSNAVVWSVYLGHPPAERTAPPPYAAPARRQNLEGLAPAWVGVGAEDLFYTEDVSYAERLQAAQVPCTLDVVPGMYHAADRFVEDAPSMIEFRGRMLVALADGLGATLA